MYLHPIIKILRNLSNNGYESLDGQAQMNQYYQAIVAALMASANSNTSSGNIGANNHELSNGQLQWSQYQQAIAAAIMSSSSTNNANNNHMMGNNLDIEQLQSYLTDQQQPISAHKHTKMTPMSQNSSTSGCSIAASDKSNAISSPNTSLNAYWRLLESLFAMNDKPEDEAIELIAQRINSTGVDVADWFQSRREAERSILYNSLSSNASNNNFVSLYDGEPNIPPTTDSPVSLAATTYKPQPPAVPSSSLLAKLNAVTSRPSSQVVTSLLDQKMIDLLEAFYAINDNPEPAAIEMIAKRINSTVEIIGDWFDEKRIKTNPHAGPRSPPAKKREGGRVVTFSEYQRSLLEAIFDENNYLHPQEYEELSNLIQVPSRNIKIWFKNRRSKQRLSGRITTP